MKNKKIWIALASLSFILTVGCGQKKDDGAAPVSAAPSSGLIAAGPSRMPQIAYSTAIVQVQGSLNTGGRAFALGDTHLTNNDVGNVTSVTIQGDVTVDQNSGAVIQQNGNRSSAVKIVVTDDKVGQPSSQGGQIEPIAAFMTAVEGRAANGQVRISFSDQYATVTITGTYNIGNPSTFQGTISFQNNNGTSGILGTFSVNTCSFFRCQ